MLYIESFYAKIEIICLTSTYLSQMRDCPSFVGCYSATITTVRNMYVELPFRCFLLIHLTYNPLAEDVGVIGIQSERNGNYHFQ